MKKIFALIASLSIVGIMLGATQVQSEAKPAAQHAKKDPCFVGTVKYQDWYHSGRWGVSLPALEGGNYFNCTGSWVQTNEDWNGHAERIRVYARSDGGQTKMRMAWYSDHWEVHDIAHTGNENVSANPTIQQDCEWPRGNNGGCSEIHIG